MKNYLETEQRIPAAYVDRNCEMGPFQVSILFQDNMTDFFYQYGCDAVNMSRTHQAVWAVVRSKLCFTRTPVWMENVRIKTFPVKITPVSIHIECLVQTPEGETLLRCRQELCPIDAENHTMRRMNTTPFPMDLEPLPCVISEPFRRRKAEVREEDLVYTHTVRSTDTDMNRHINNVAYVRLIADAFPSEFWDKHRIETFDIQYVSEGWEGEEVKILAREEDGEQIVFVQCGERTLIKAFFKVKSRELTEI